MVERKPSKLDVAGSSPVSRLCGRVKKEKGGERIGRPPRPLAAAFGVTGSARSDVLA